MVKDLAYKNIWSLRNSLKNRRKNDTGRFMGMGNQSLCHVHESGNVFNGHVCLLSGNLFDTGLERKMKEYMELQLEVLKYEQMVERREEKIKKLQNVIASQDPNDLHRFRCWHCDSELIWGGDHDIQEVMLEEDKEGIASNFSCSNYDCNTHVEVYHFLQEEE
jgi:hypothetical protein|tara:strand:+ start:42 stop:530 length:489 start_codon:yes stop_codon:yes gene_type:complete